METLEVILDRIWRFLTLCSEELLGVFQSPLEVMGWAWICLMPGQRPNVCAAPSSSGTSLALSHLCSLCWTWGLFGVGVVLGGVVYPKTEPCS